MSNRDFNRAVNFLQGALNISAASAAEKPQEPQERQDDLLPGFEPPKAVSPEEPESPPATAEEPAALDDAFTPPPDADAPPLPGMATLSTGKPISVVHLKAEKSSSLELHPPAKKRAALAAQAAREAQNAKPMMALRFSPISALAALSGLLGTCLIVALVCLMRAPEASVEKVPTGIPLALLPETADASLWETVSAMSGEIDGVFLSFERGLATDGTGKTYKLMLDFCQCGPDIYAKVAGERTYVVRLDADGKITKAYPAPKNNKPLKAIFGK